MGLNKSYAETHAFWRDLRKGKAAKQQTTGVRAVRHQLDFGRTPSSLAAHRAQLEHDVLWKNAIREVRQAAREYDEWVAEEKAKKREKKGKGSRISVPRSRRKVA